MKKLILIFALSLALFAQSTASFKNPKVYSALGDVIYDNVEKIKNLKNIKKYASFIIKVDEYILNVAETKKLGFEVESGQKSEQKSDYLAKLRKLSKINDYFFRSAYNSFKTSLNTQNNDLFVAIINTKMIDTKKYKSKILNYYKSHSKEINPTGIIQNLIDQDNAKKNNKLYIGKTKQELLEQKMKRIRQNDKEKQESLEKKLAKEIQVKKDKIREEQTRELFK